MSSSVGPHLLSLHSTVNTLASWYVPKSRSATFFSRGRKAFLRARLTKSTGKVLNPKQSFKEYLSISRQLDSNVADQNSNRPSYVEDVIIREI